VSFRQRYFLCEEHYKKGGPIFFYVGNEADVTLCAPCISPAVGNQQILVLSMELNVSPTCSHMAAACLTPSGLLGSIGT
jgi:hypothetical protein